MWWGHRGYSLRLRLNCFCFALPVANSCCKLCIVLSRYLDTSRPTFAAKFCWQPSPISITLSAHCTTATVRPHVRLHCWWVKRGRSPHYALLPAFNPLSHPQPTFYPYPYATEVLAYVYIRTTSHHSINSTQNGLFNALEDGYVPWIFVLGQWFNHYECGRLSWLGQLYGAL